MNLHESHDVWFAARIPQCFIIFIGNQLGHSSYTLGQRALLPCCQPTHQGADLAEAAIIAAIQAPAIEELEQASGDHGRNIYILYIYIRKYYIYK